MSCPMEQTRTPLKATPLSVAVGISKVHASHVIRGIKTPSKDLAIRIYRATGEKLGPIAGATDEDIAVLERFEA